MSHHIFRTMYPICERCPLQALPGLSDRTLWPLTLLVRTLLLSGRGSTWETWEGWSHRHTHSLAGKYFLHSKTNYGHGMMIDDVTVGEIWQCSLTFLLAVRKMTGKV